MDKSLSEESRGLLRDMQKSEAWRIFEAIQKKSIENSRVLATRQTTPLEDRLWHSAEAQGRENAISELNDLLYDSRTEPSGREAVNG